MALSYQNYTGDNTTTTFSIPFTYQNTSEITVTVDGVAETPLTFPSTSTVQLGTAPATGTLVQVRRTTSLTARAVDFASGSVLTEEDLDNSSIQVFHAAQEANDRVGDTIGLDTTNRWDAGGNIIKNVGDPVNNTDAVNKQFLSANLPDITTVAGIASDVTGVANIASDVTAVAADATDIGTVATDIANVNTNATNIASINTNAANISDIQNASTNATTATTKASEASGFADEAEAWAQKTDGEAVASEGYSSKAWAVGGTGVTDTAGSGPAKDWAVETLGSVDGTEYSAKEYSIGTGNNSGMNTGSAKQWSLGGGTSFDRDTAVAGGEYSAKYWANQAKNETQSQRDVYYGAFTSDAAAESYQTGAAPTGNAGTVDVGDLYFNSTSNTLRVRSSSGWQDSAADTSSFATNGFAIAMAIAL